MPFRSKASPVDDSNPCWRTPCPLLWSQTSLSYLCLFVRRVEKATAIKDHPARIVQPGGGKHPEVRARGRELFDVRVGGIESIHAATLIAHIKISVRIKGQPRGTDCRVLANTEPAPDGVNTKTVLAPAFATKIASGIKRQASLGLPTPELAKTPKSVPLCENFDAVGPDIGHINMPLASTATPRGLLTFVVAKRSDPAAGTDAADGVAGVDHVKHLAPRIPATITASRYQCPHSLIGSESGSDHGVPHGDQKPNFWQLERTRRCIFRGGSTVTQKMFPRVLSKGHGNILFPRCFQGCFHRHWGVSSGVSIFCFHGAKMFPVFTPIGFENGKWKHFGFVPGH